MPIQLDKLTEEINEEIKRNMREDKEYARMTLVYILHHHKLNTWNKIVKFL